MENVVFGSWVGIQNVWKHCPDSLAVLCLERPSSCLWSVPGNLLSASLQSQLLPSFHIWAEAFSHHKSLSCLCTAAGHWTQCQREIVTALGPKSIQRLCLNLLGNGPWEADLSQNLSILGGNVGKPVNLMTSLLGGKGWLDGVKSIYLELKCRSKVFKRRWASCLHSLPLCSQWKWLPCTRFSLLG